MIILLLAILFLTLGWQLVIICTNRQKHQQLILAQQQLQSCALQIGLAAMQEENHNLLDFYNGLGQSIAALHIQLQVTQKLWQINPTQAQQSLSEAYQLTSQLMHEIRQIVKSIDRYSYK